MQKIYQKTSSSTQKLSVINGMYPQVSCNHRMRAGNHQLNEVISKEQARIRHNWKLEREAKKFLKIVGEEFAKNLMNLIDHQYRLGQKRSLGVVSIGDTLKLQNPHVFEQLNGKK